MKLTISWAHLASPQGESFQGWWLMRQGQPLNRKPYASKEEAVDALNGVRMIDRIGKHILDAAQNNRTVRESQATDDAFNLIDAAYRIIIRFDPEKK